jgi:hypothetical protein
MKTATVHPSFLSNLHKLESILKKRDGAAAVVLGALSFRIVSSVPSGSEYGDI